MDEEAKRILDKIIKEYKDYIIEHLYEDEGYKLYYIDDNLRSDMGSRYKVIYYKKKLRMLAKI